MLLNKFLSHFSYSAVQRSLEYLSHIDYSTIQFTPHHGNIMMGAKIKGTYYYHTHIIYSPAKNAIIGSECSCPVSDYCKHGAALAHVFYTNFLNDIDLSLSASNIAVQLNKPEEHLDNVVHFPESTSNATHQKASQWLQEFKQNLLQTTATKPTENARQFIYVLTQTHKLSTSVFKVRRNKDGEIKEAKSYSTFDNILYYKIAMPKHERTLFTLIYNHASLNKENIYAYYSDLTLQNMSLEIFKQLIQSGDCYWQHHQNNKPLLWSETVYAVDFQWQYNTQQQTEKLTLNLTHTNNTPPPKNIRIIYTRPLSYLDLDTLTMGELNTPYTADVIHKLLNMPPIPSSLINEVSEILQTNPATKSLPPSKAAQQITDVYGACTPVLRFGDFDNLMNFMLDNGQGLAEVCFDYDSGRIKANSTKAFFIGKQQGQTVRQFRDIKQEKQHITKLQKLIASLQWASQHPASRYLANKPNAALVCANLDDWSRQIIPTNQIQALGWKIEHLQDSIFNLQAAQHIEFSLNESSSQQNWFELGATIQDQQGNVINLKDLLTGLIQNNPALLKPDNLEKLNDDGFFSFQLGNNQPDLAILIKDIKPILLHLGHLLQQDSHGIDRYDAAHILELQHLLGMPWQNNERLTQFANKLKQGYQQQLPTPQGFNGELRPYQQQGLGWLQFLRDTEHGGILADDMGLGKTAQTLAHILLEKQAGHLANKPALIIAPTSLMYNWLREAQKFTPDLKVLVLQGQNRHQDFDKIDQYDIVLSTYPLLARDEEVLNKYSYHLLILDEAQNIKNPQAKAAHVVRQLDAKHRLCLTGTPMENHLGELWSLFYFLMPGFLSSQDVFNKKYRHPIEKQGDNQLRQKLVNRIKPFMLRRLKVDVAKELPPKTTIEVNIDMNEAQSKLYEAVRVAMQSSIQDIIAKQGFKRSQILILDALLKLRQVCCHPSLLKLEKISSSKANSAKLEQLLDMVTEMVEEGRKILIFSQFTTMLTLIEDNLNKQKIDFVKLTGQTKKREEAINAFQSGQVPVFLISLKAGGVGLNLTAADTVIHYDPWWNPAAEDQASDRAWRIGQDKPVFVYKLITNQSIEEKILALQKNKAQLAQSILSHDKEQDIKLSEEDMMNLFETF